VSFHRSTETELWTNPSPSTDFAAQTITLSEDMTNYTYLKFYCKALKTGTKTFSIIIPVEDFVASTTGSTLTDDFRFCLTNGGAPKRTFQYKSNTQITFSGASYISCPNTYTMNQTAYPLVIYGVN